MNPIEDSRPATLVPIPREHWSLRRLLPSMGFVALVTVHEVLGCAAAILWYHDESFLPLQITWYCAWQSALLVYFAVNHFRIRASLSLLRTAAFWIVQAAWFALGLWCFGVVFVSQPFAIEGVGAWLVGAYLLAALAEDIGRPRSAGRKDDSYFTEIFKRPMTPE